MKNSMLKVIEVFLSHLTNRKTVSVRTLDYYRNELFLLLQLMEQGGKSEWGELCFNEVNTFIQQEKNVNKTIHIPKKRYIREFFLFMYQNGFIDKDIICANKRRNIMISHFKD